MDEVAWSHARTRGDTCGDGGWVVTAKQLVDMLVVMCAECVGGARGVGVGWVEVGGVAAL